MRLEGEVNPRRRLRELVLAGAAPLVEPGELGAALDFTRLLVGATHAYLHELRGLAEQLQPGTALPPPRLALLVAAEPRERFLQHLPAAGLNGVHALLVNNIRSLRHLKDDHNGAGAAADAAAAP